MESIAFWKLKCEFLEGPNGIISDIIFFIEEDKQVKPPNRV